MAGQSTNTSQGVLEASASWDAAAHDNANLLRVTADQVTPKGNKKEKERKKKDWQS